MTELSKDEITALLSEAEAGKKCWARRLNSQASQFLIAVEERENASAVGVLRVLQRLDPDLSVSSIPAIRNHLKRLCSCPKKS